MKVVYISHPISGNVEKNLESLRQIIAHINRTEPHVIPFVPYYADVVSMDDNKEKDRARGLKNALHNVRFCDEIRLYGDRISDGMKNEALEAMRLNKSVYFYEFLPTSVLIQKLHYSLAKDIDYSQSSLFNKHDKVLFRSGAYSEDIGIITNVFIRNLIRYYSIERENRKNIFFVVEDRIIKKIES